MRMQPGILIALSMFTFLIGTATLRGEPNIPEEVLEKLPREIRYQFLPRIQPLNYVPKSPGHYSKQDWAGAIDATWGEGLPYEDKIALFTDLWGYRIDGYFGAFHGLDANLWDSIWIADSAEIYDTVSRGRFAGMIQHSCMALRESHTATWDSTVSLTTPLPGVPIMYVGGWGRSSHFGAGLTPMPDSSLLVYKAIESHPLDLVPGDLILGYDGIPWKDLYPELLEAQLPMGRNWWYGSSESAFTHSWLMACGENWHLFDIIDIVKYDSGDTLHLPTSLLVDQNMNMWLWATEQMAIPGVEMPVDYANWITWGLIDGTSIGYIYSIGWHGNSDTVISKWNNALDSLMNYYTTTGLIMDVRTNYGASYSYLEPLEILFDDTVQAFGADRRCTGGGHLDMCPAPQWWCDRYCIVNGDPSTYYDKPIAVLTGPGALSGGDLFPIIMAHHPMTKLFGKPTSGARNGADVVDLGYDDWGSALCKVNTYLLADPGEYLTRKEFPSATEFPWADYEEVWLTQEGVAQGRDDVVEAAKAWILSHYVCGDANGDESVNVGDAVYLLNYVFRPDECVTNPPIGCPPFELMAADNNGDGNVNIGDVVYINNFIFAPEQCDINPPIGCPPTCGL